MAVFPLPLPSWKLQTAFSIRRYFNMFFLAPVAALVSTTAVEAFTLGATTAVAVNRLKKKRK